MTEGSKKVLKFLQDHPDKEYAKREIAEELDIPVNVVSGSINAMRTKGFVEERIDTYPSPTQKSVMVEVRWAKITQLGLEFNPEEEEKREARERARLTAARKAERKREKAERAKRNAVL